MDKKMKIEIITHEDDVSHHETLSFKFCGVDHSKYIKEIDDRLESGDLWAWCCVEVRVSQYGLSYSHYMGGSSYLNQEDFKQGGYYEQMLEDATADLTTDIQAIVEAELAAKVGN